MLPIQGRTVGLSLDPHAPAVFPGGLLGLLVGPTIEARGRSSTVVFGQSVLNHFQMDVVAFQMDDGQHSTIAVVAVAVKSDAALEDAFGKVASGTDAEWLARLSLGFGCFRRVDPQQANQASITPLGHHNRIPVEDADHTTAGG